MSERNLDDILRLAGVKEDDYFNGYVTVEEAVNVKEKETPEYKEFFDKALKKFGVSSPEDLEGEKKKEFYDYIDKNWASDKEMKAVSESENAVDATVDKSVDNADDLDDKEERMGIDRSKVVKVPQEVVSQCKQRIKELEKSIETYDDKGYNDYSDHRERAIETINKILDHFNTGDLESFKEAQILYTTLPSGVTHLLPYKLVLFITTTDKDKDTQETLTKEVK